MNKKVNASVVFCWKHSPDRNKLDLYDKKGELIIADITLEKDYQDGYAIISHDHKKNVIDNDGRVLLYTWVDDIFLTKDFSLIKIGDKWGMANMEGTIVEYPQYNSIKRTKYQYTSRSSYPIAIVEVDSGVNVLLMNKEKEFFLGFPSPVEQVSFIAADSCIAKTDGKWHFYKRCDDYFYTLTQGTEAFDSVDSSIVETNWLSFWKVCKDGKYNLLDSTGRLRLKEWYSSIEVCGLTAIVSLERFHIEPAAIDDSVDANVSLLYNLISIQTNDYLLNHWFECIKCYIIDDYLVVNIDPVLSTMPNGNIKDTSIQYNNSDKDGSKQLKVSCVKGKCNVYNNIFWPDWYNQIAFIDGKLFNHGLAKVYKDSKCNLVDIKGNLELNEWVDEIISQETWNKPSSYFSYDVPGAIKVKNEGKINFVSCGRYLFEQWFTQIGQMTGNGYFPVKQGWENGLYSPTKGLIGGKCFNEIQALENDLFYCFDGSSGSGYILDIDGQVVSHGNFRGVSPFVNGFAEITGIYDNRGKFNFIDANGIIVSDVWFDEKPYYGYRYDTERYPEYLIVHNDGKANVINSNKCLLFKTWYNSISGFDNNWIVSIVENEVESFFFIDNNENRLTIDSYSEIYDLDNLGDGCHIVRTTMGYNIIDRHYKYTLPQWYKKRIYNHDGLLSINIHGDNYCFINKEGHLISDACGTIHETFEAKIDGQNKKFYILKLNDGRHILNSYANLDPKFVLLCNSEGISLFNDIINDTTSRCSSIRNLSIPGYDNCLIIDRSYPWRHNEASKYSIISYSGKVLLEGPLDSIGDYNKDGYSLVSFNGKYNLMTQDL